MKKFRKKISFTVSVMLIGSMILLSGCKASDGPTSEIEALPDEKVVEVVAATDTQPAEPETKDEKQDKLETEIKTETKAEPAEEETVQTKPEPENEPDQKETVPAAGEDVASFVSEGSVSDSDYAVIVKGVTIPLRGDMRNYTASLGDPDDFASAKSCTEAGEDKVYTYGGAVIYTYITNGADVISLIEITGSETLVSGIHIGSTKEEVIVAFGSAYTEQGSEWLYEMGNKTIGLEMSGDKVSFIELFG
ncbi:MAG: hypothetical protein K2N89_09875 [Lachnospiraceae bacterium]|nr:hypothetical protein [Lachnospiraceae bacterium]